MSAPGSTGRGALSAALVVLAVGIFVYHARIYWQWTEDDAFITFRYAQNLANGHGLVFNPGERVEGYSNFSWLLMSAAGVRAGLDPVALAKAVGLVAGGLAVALSWLLARRLVPGIGMTALLAPYYLAISPVLVQHSIAGLETSLFAMLLAAGVLLATSGWSPLQRALLVLTLLLLSLTRPEGVIVAAVLLLLRGALAGRSRRRAAVDFGIFAALFGAYDIWRWSYFHSALPNTYYAKVSGGLAGIIDGAQYTLDFMRDSGGELFIALALVPLILSRTRAGYWLALAVFLTYVGFVVVSGGDWMFHYRFYAHALPVLAALLAAGVDVLLRQPRPGTVRAAALYGSMALVLLATCASMGNSELRVARMVLPALKGHNYLSQNYEDLGRWLHDNTPPDAAVAISDVGAVGYFSNRKILDMFGLIDAHIARMGGRMHYKADPKYVLSRKPEYIVLVSLNDEGKGYSFQRIPDYAMNAQPAFHDQYELIRTVQQYWQNEYVLVYRRRL